MSKKLKRFKRLVRRPFEWLGIWLGWLVFAHVSHRMLFRICDFIAAVGYPFDRKGRELSRENLRLVVGAEHLTPRREELILKRSYRNMVRTLGHVFWTSRNARAPLPWASFRRGAWSSSRRTSRPSRSAAIWAAGRSSRSSSSSRDARS